MMGAGAPRPSSGPTSTEENRSRARSDARSRSTLPISIERVLGACARPLRGPLLCALDSCAPDAVRPLAAQRSARLHEVQGQAS